MKREGLDPTTRRLARALVFTGVAFAAGQGVASAQDYFGVDVGEGVTTAPWRGGRHSGPLPSHHVVHRGDTLWDITGYYLGNPWDWPRVWAINPEIANPHWIYPNDRVRLQEGADTTAVSDTGNSGGNRPQAMPRNSIRTRNEGYIDREALDNDGHIVGAPSERMMLSQGDEIWVRYEDDDERPARGRQLTIYRDIPRNERRSAESGDLVRILGTATVRSFDEDRGLVRAEITEASEPIERGFRVAEMPRDPSDVAPVANDRDIETQVAATLHPRDMVADNTYIFVEVGEEEGVRVGNRFFVVRQGDPYFDATSDQQGDGVRGDGLVHPESGVEYPVEIIGEARVVSLRPHSATLAVTQSVQEIRVGDTLQMRSGF